MKLVKESLNENLSLLTLKDLAEIGSRTQHPDMKEMAEKVFLDAYIKTFRKEGDEGVIKLFKQQTDLELEAIRKGRYYIK